MQHTDTPSLIPIAFAASGSKRAVPTLAADIAAANQPSLETGFPPVTMIPKVAGGIPPSGPDMNGALNLLSAANRWAQAGGMYPYNSAFSTSIGGYPKGATLLSSDGTSIWQSAAENNTTDPDSGGAANWVNRSNASGVALTDSGDYTGANVESALTEIATMLYGTRYSVEDARFGAAPAKTAAQNTAAIQACVNAAPEGSVIWFPGLYSISDEISVSKSLAFMGPGPTPLYVRSAVKGLKQTVAGKACFKIVPTLGMYAFSQYGVLGCNFIGLAAEGPSSASRALAFVRVDTTVNGGDFHVRENQFRGCSLRWFQTALDIAGIAYLNDFYSNHITYCDTAVKFSRGTASDVGGQNRFFGGAYLQNGKAFSLYEDTYGGSFGFHGVSISENTVVGIIANEEVALYTSPDCEFESNAIGIQINITDNANPGSSSPKRIYGKFLSNGNDVYINKTSTGFSGGGFEWNMRIGGLLSSAYSLKIDVPAGHTGIDGNGYFVIERGAHLSGALSPFFYGNIEGKGEPVTRRFAFNNLTTTGATIAMLPTNFVVRTVRLYFSANASTFTGVNIGDQNNGARYLGPLNAQTNPINAWSTYNSTLGDLIDSTRNIVQIVFTAGAPNGCAGVIEIDGYLR